MYSHGQAMDRHQQFMNSHGQGKCYSSGARRATIAIIATIARIATTATTTLRLSVSVIARVRDLAQVWAHMASLGFRRGDRGI